MASEVKVGIGSEQPRWVLCIANRPELDKFQHEIFTTLKLGEAAEIIHQTSNHWRKLFSIMAKISFALFETGCDTWQQYRDTKLLTAEGFETISFEPVEEVSRNAVPCIVAGFTYADTQVDLAQFLPLENDAKVLCRPGSNIVVTPYFDWRQLTNAILENVILVIEAKVTASPTQ